MLLEYTLDTADEKMVAKAIEIRRRVASRKLIKSIEDGIVDDDQLLKLKEMNRDERKSHITESFTVVNVESKERIAMSRAEQQFTVEQKIRSLDSDVSRAARLGKSRIDTLSDMEKRIHQMRNQLKDATIQSVDAEISMELRSKNNSALDHLFETCQKCNRRILVDLMQGHKRNCEGLNQPTVLSLKAKEPIFKVDQDLITSIATFPPQPPRNCVVVSKGCSFIQWQWEPPVIDGGLPVTDYEISCTAKISEFNVATGKYKRWDEDYSSIRTSYWCYNNPSCENGYKMVGLRAGTEYTNFKIRCCNLRGWSEWFNMINPDQPSGQAPAKIKKDNVTSNVTKTDKSRAKQPVLKTLTVDQSSGKYANSIFTDEPEPPSPPLFFTCIKVTSSCIHLNWQHPWFDGGSRVIDYTLHYTVKERVVTVTSREVINENIKKLKVKSDATFKVIRNLPSETDVVNIFITATNFVGLVSERAQVMIGNKIQTVIRTQPSSRYMQLSRELAVTSASNVDWIDSAFFTGIRQRLKRVEHIKKLRDELTITTPDPLDLEEAQEWAAIQEAERIKREAEAEQEAIKKKKASQMMGKRIKKGDLLNDSNNTMEGNDEDEDDIDEMELAKSANNFLFSFRQRKQHFRLKIKSLERQFQDLIDEKMTIDKNRTMFTFEMKSKEERQMELKLEIERLKSFHGRHITSSVLSGSNMQYQIEDYRLKIEKAHDECVREVTTLKFKIIEGENRRIHIKTDLEQTETLRKDRMAKFLEFEINYKKVLNKVEKLKSSTHIRRTMMKIFNQLKKNMKYRQAGRRQLTNLFKNKLRRLKRVAFLKWKTGDYFIEKKTQVKFCSAGGVLLQQSMDKRVELQGLLREAISGTSNIRQKLQLVNISITTKKKLMTSKDFKGMEEGIDHESLLSRGMHYLYEGDGYAMENIFDAAKDMYEAQIIALRSKPNFDIKLLALCHGRLGKMFLKLKKKNRAIVEFDRQLSLAKEIGDKPEEAEAYFGLGTGYLQAYDYDNAIRYLNIAQALFNALGNNPKYCGAMRTLSECYERTNKMDKANILFEKIEMLEDDLRSKLSHMNVKLEEFRNRLSNTTAEIEFIVNIERTTFQALALRKSIEKRTADLAAVDAELNQKSTESEMIKKTLDAIYEELKEAEETDEPEMWSKLVHDQPQVVEIEELKYRLKQRVERELDKLKIADKKSKLVANRMKNAEDDIEEFEKLLQLEEGALVKHTRNDKTFRCVALCAANAAGNEVTGTATGGFEEFIAAEGTNIHVLDYHNGLLKHVYLGDSKFAGIGEKIGHTGVITCLLHDGKLLFSGSTDETIIIWDSETYSKIMALRGHEGSIVALAVESKILASGSADATIRLWNKHDGRQLRVVYGHSRSVLTMDLGSTWMVTGSADSEVRVWNVMYRNKYNVTAECTYRLIGHNVPVCCVKYGKVEVVSGDVKGRIFIWWMATGQVLRQCQVHNGSVKCLQFDSLHIVSGGVDNQVCITDIATGEVLQSLRGHTGHILALAFDSERILSISGDNTVRYWQWGKKSGPRDKYHTFDKGDSLLKLSKQYEVSVEDLMKWNGILETKHMHQGMKLLVRKGDPTVLTDAEKFILEKEKSRQSLGTGIGKVKKEIGLGSSQKQELDSAGALAKYDRVHRLATDIDFFSLANRMFGREKWQQELFLDSYDPNKEIHSLAARIKTASDPVNANGNEIVVKKVQSSGVRPVYYIHPDNEDEEWGTVADAVGLTMISLFVEYEAYSIVMEEKRELQSKQSVQGRIAKFGKRDRKLRARKKMVEEAGGVWKGDEKEDEDSSITTMQRPRKSKREIDEMKKAKLKAEQSNHLIIYNVEFDDEKLGIKLMKAYQRLQNDQDSINSWSDSSKPIVAEVFHDSIAEKKSVKVGDTIVAVNGKPTPSFDGFMSEYSFTISRPITLSFVRGYSLEADSPNEQNNEKSATKRVPITTHDDLMSQSAFSALTSISEQSKSDDDAEIPPKNFNARDEKGKKTAARRLSQRYYDFEFAELKIGIKLVNGYFDLKALKNEVRNPKEKNTFVTRPYVSSIRQDSEAMRKGIREGDVLMTVNGNSINDYYSFSKQFTQMQSRPLRLRVLRGITPEKKGIEVNSPKFSGLASISIADIAASTNSPKRRFLLNDSESGKSFFGLEEDRNETAVAEGIYNIQFIGEKLGMNVTRGYSSLSDDQTKSMKEGNQLISKPIVSLIKEGSAAWDKGVRMGDIVVAINGKPVPNFDTFRSVFSESTQRPITISFFRGMNLAINEFIMGGNSGKESSQVAVVENAATSNENLESNVKSLTEQSDGKENSDTVPNIARIVSNDLSDRSHPISQSQATFQFDVSFNQPTLGIKLLKRYHKQERLNGDNKLASYPMIGKVYPDSEAILHGVQVEDRLMEINGEPIANYEDFMIKFKANSHRPISIRFERKRLSNLKNSGNENGNDVIPLDETNQELKTSDNLIIEHGYIDTNGLESITIETDPLMEDGVQEEIHDVQEDYHITMEAEPVQHLEQQTNKESNSSRKVALPPLSMNTTSSSVKALNNSNRENVLLFPDINQTNTINRQTTETSQNSNQSSNQFAKEIKKTWRFFPRII